MGFYFREMDSTSDYLGDGVYVSHDGYQIWLAANSPDNPEKIALEPRVFRQLCFYAERAFRMRITCESVDDEGAAMGGSA